VHCRQFIKLFHYSVKSAPMALAVENASIL